MYYCVSTVVQFKKRGDSLKWELEKNRPICPQIYEIICVKIANGEIPANSKLFSVREVALIADVNPNTVQKSFEMLEKDGLIFSVRGSGWFVKENIEVAKQTVEKLVSKKTKSYFKEMEVLGFDKNSAKQYVKEWED